MSELNDFNQRVISEFRANQGKVGGQLANMPVLLLTTTGAKSGRTLTKPLVYTTDGDRIVVLDKGRLIAPVETQRDVAEQVESGDLGIVQDAVDRDRLLVEIHDADDVEV